jgi:hypothetical protein
MRELGYVFPDRTSRASGSTLSTRTLIVSPSTPVSGCAEGDRIDPIDDITCASNVPSTSSLSQSVAVPDTAANTPVHNIRVTASGTVSASGTASEQIVVANGNSNSDHASDSSYDFDTQDPATALVVGHHEMSDKSLLPDGTKSSRASDILACSAIDADHFRLVLSNRSSTDDSSIRITFQERLYDIRPYKRRCQQLFAATSSRHLLSFRCELYSELHYG